MHKSHTILLIHTLDTQCDFKLKSKYSVQSTLENSIYCKNHQKERGERKRVNKPETKRSEGKKSSPHSPWIIRRYDRRWQRRSHSDQRFERTRLLRNCGEIHEIIVIENALISVEFGVWCRQFVAEAWNSMPETCRRRCIVRCTRRWRDRRRKVQQHCRQKLGRERNIGEWKSRLD